ncbi:MAG TPA: hypothetical protein VNJ11_01070 [Bryobacteraceae bacterium]|nr:hypothetical protein [Bryobacteraceae bacterium]
MTDGLPVLPLEHLPAILAARPGACLLCGRQGRIHGVFFPDNPEAWAPATRNHERKAVAFKYSLCKCCARRGARTLRKVEAKIRLALMPAAGGVQ